MRLLGDVVLSRVDGVSQALHRDKSTLLLAFLALHDERPLHRNAIAETIWEGVESENARNAFRVTLTRLRRMLGSGEVFLAEGNTLRLNPAFIGCDILQFSERLAQARRTPAENRIERLRAALLLYNGPLLPGMEDSWAFSERQRLEDECLRARGELAELLYQEGAWDEAIAQCRLALETNELREETHVQLLRLYRLAGRGADAQEHYEEVVRLFHERRLPLSPQLKQMLTPDLPSQPLADENGQPAPSLPRVLTRFFGREDELQALEALLKSEDARLVTITGMGGSGKTRLALEAARRIEAERALYFVALADVRSPEQLPEAILTVLQAQGESSQEPAQRVVTALRQRPGVLILDSLELLEGEPTRTFLKLLLQSIPTLTILTTSRRRLGMAAEQVLPLLPLPAPGEGFPDSRLEEFACVALFVDRAHLLTPEFALTPENRAAIAQMCRLLEGLPLAIEMAAARVLVLTPEQIATRIAQRFQFLVSRNKDVAPRHLSLRATLEWSYELLSPESQRFLRSLSVFRGGWSLEAAEAVCESFEALDILSELRDASLLDAQSVLVAGKPEVRYRLLETIRQFLDEKLPTSPERQTLELRHIAWCARIATTIQSLSGAVRNAWLDLEYENLQAALLHPALAPDAPERAVVVRLLLTRWWGYPLTGYWDRHVLPFVEQLRAGGEHTATMQDLLWSYVRKQINVARSPEDVEEHLFTLFRRAPSVEQRMAEHQLRAALYSNFGPLDEALRCLKLRVEEPALGREQHCFGLMDLSWLKGRLGEYDEACELMEQARTLINNRESESWWAGLIECRLGYLELRRGRLDVAHAFLEIAAHHLRELGEPQMQQTVPPIQGMLLLAEGRPQEALPLFRQHIAYFQSQDVREVIFSVKGLASCALGLQQPTLALWLLGVRHAIDEVMHLYATPHEHEELSALRADAEAAGGAPSAWEAAIVLPYNDAIPLLLEKINHLFQV